jgi:hypothetical protein
MKLFARACLAASIALVPIACGSDEKTPATPDEDAGDLCGNGKIDGDEQCDKEDLGGATCSEATLGASPTGTLSCTAACQFNTSQCQGTATGGAPGTGGTGGMGPGGMMGGPDAGDAGDAGGTGGGGTGGGGTGGGGTGGGGTGGTVDSGAPEAGTPDGSADASND